MTTEAGRALLALLADADIRWPDDLTRITPSALAPHVAVIEAEAAKRERERIVGLVEALERHICEPCEPDPEGWAIDRAAVLTAIREEQSHAD